MGLGVGVGWHGDAALGVAVVGVFHYQGATLRKVG